MYVCMHVCRYVGRNVCRYVGVYVCVCMYCVYAYEATPRATPATCSPISDDRNDRFLALSESVHWAKLRSPVFPVRDVWKAREATNGFRLSSGLGPWSWLNSEYSAFAFHITGKRSPLSFQRDLLQPVFLSMSERYRAHPRVGAPARHKNLESCVLSLNPTRSYRSSSALRLCIGHKQGISLISLQGFPCLNCKGKQGTFFPRLWQQERPYVYSLFLHK